MINISNDLQVLEIGFEYHKLGLTIEEAKLRYLKMLEKGLSDINSEKAA